ncbi:hypothetical protein CHS0354_015865 [Potamilus streckersoni]|uniref:Uncharacterized protein n=1 Tax=Potamilus streckersoni TaxID=2493646 RepID=A0AAE0VUN4_9BIVA|nr:hypothetical protein CHS0354_015865 [Potamilus streckersoni]
MCTFVDVMMFTYVCFLIGSRLIVQSLYLEECNNVLGMQSYEIPDEAISASSSHDEKTVGPQNARIRTELYGGAWCPKSVISKDSYEYLQIDFDKLTVITQVEVQGRFGNGKGKEYATHFLLEYQREDGGEWTRFRNKTGSEVFDGNSNTYITEVRKVSPPIIGKRIRLIPYSRYPRTICMRVEVYGCPWLDGVVSYDVRQGDKRGSEVDLFDFSYDGMIMDNYLTQGIGQLTDGEYGDTNFRLDKPGFGIKGYEWVGWKNDSIESGGPVEIKFKFNTVRRFSSVTIHSSNYFLKEIKLFQRAEVYFSIGGKYFLTDPIQYQNVQDSTLENARNITIPLQNGVGKYVKLKLYFDAKWILISEVLFQSVMLNGTFYPEEAHATEQPPVSTSGHLTQNKYPKIEEIDVLKPYGTDIVSTESINGQHTRASTKAIDEDYISIVIGTLSAIIVILVIIVVVVIVRLKRRRNSRRRTLMSATETSLALKLNNVHGSGNEKVSNGKMYKGLAIEDTETSKALLNGNVAGTCIKVTDPNKEKEGSLVVALPVDKDFGQKSFTITHHSLVNPMDKPPNYEAFYAAADVISSQNPDFLSLQGVSGNSIYAVPSAGLRLGMDHAVIEFPRENLRFVEVLGKGQFGEVHLCETLDVTEYIQDGNIAKKRISSRTLVAVKILQTDSDDRARADFEREIKVMSALSDPNIVRVLGVCTRGEPVCMIVEYMVYGDLNQFLLDHVPDTNMSVPKAKRLSYGCQIHMGSQIASGMKYLESLNMVHRDLATRNCLVGTNFTIKISDFGMSRTLYSADYYRIQGRVILPVRWMAWESILLGKFTTKSDVWSFAVTLWEILTFARDHPYEGLSDEQVIENAGHHNRNDNQQLYLPQPFLCPKEMYDLMLECWNRHESERPSFRDIHMFLQRKNIGYDSKNDTFNE